MGNFIKTHDFQKLIKRSSKKSNCLKNPIIVNCTHQFPSTSHNFCGLLFQMKPNIVPSAFASTKALAVIIALIMKYRQVHTSSENICLINYFPLSSLIQSPKAEQFMPQHASAALRTWSYCVACKHRNFHNDSPLMLI